MNCESFDVLVIGAGAAGITAALQAARAGAAVCLVEKNGIPGGTMTVSGIHYPGIFNAWGRQVIAGIGWELVAKTLETMGRPMPDFSRTDMTRHWEHQILLDPVIFAAIVDRELLAAGVTIKYHTMLGALSGEESGWAVTLCGRDGLYEVKSKVVADCSGDANAAKLAGYEVRTSEPCQPGTMSVYATGYHLKSLDLDAIGNAFLEAVRKGEVCAEDTGWAGGFNPNVLIKRGNNSNHISGINACDSAGRTKIEIAGRESLLRLYRFLRRQPGLEQLEVRLDGPECGVRETRTIVGEDTVTAADYAAGRKYPDALCNAFYPIDLHDAKVGLDKRGLAPGTVPQVPRGALIPAHSRRFVAAGRLLSSDRLANSALRVQAVCMATGQAAGAMAALSAKSGADPLRLELAEIRALLKRHGAIVPE